MSAMGKFTTRTWFRKIEIDFPSLFLQMIEFIFHSIRMIIRWYLRIQLCKLK